ncbi:carboxypeptidase-like regulatory domain-containing protein [Blastopirellula sp. JC732]|uniref:Carboxypeptidase-like regulatory domain-containing protein n=1 Tax=Blastopirellula sediminis TaxID=2894196 RepID=A0A9X1MLZ6_9BACT|nr:carboxypeptidase-like regulatory domain-containing protein [Blastopirellula sediminis]MCC9609274.1 carboxypeptidase-like regulatory domain-containing protein [Blastopirellula sediminis]MCC9627949.1 carboxypeptidase-like regulatory domain-containing protein [Blastopirellula sediminis]
MAIRYAALLAIVAVVGCYSNKPDLDFGEVQGKVTLNGKPLQNAKVRFQPEVGRPSYGATDADGEYTLYFMGEPWGALVGANSVAITTENMIEDQNTGETKFIREFLPKKYHAETTLTAQVQPGANRFDFDLVDEKKRK